MMKKNTNANLVINPLTIIIETYNQRLSLKRKDEYPQATISIEHIQSHHYQIKIKEYQQSNYIKVYLETSINLHSPSNTCIELFLPTNMIKVQIHDDILSNNIDLITQYIQETLVSNKENQENQLQTKAIFPNKPIATIKPMTSTSTNDPISLLLGEIISPKKEFSTKKAIRLHEQSSNNMNNNIIDLMSTNYLTTGLTPKHKRIDHHKKSPVAIPTSNNKLSIFCINQSTNNYIIPSKSTFITTNNHNNHNNHNNIKQINRKLCFDQENIINNTMNTNNNNDNNDNSEILILSNPIQQHILQSFHQHKNLFITGGGGTGKSTLLKHLIDLANHQYTQDHQVMVLATTGLAACAVNGITIHQFLGLTPMMIESNTDKAWEQAKQTICRRNHIQQRCQLLHILFIDEISMLEPRLFELLDEILRITRQSTEVMGGIQLIACGDFFQLPPIQKSTLDKPILTSFYPSKSPINTLNTLNTTNNTNITKKSTQTSSQLSNKYCFQSKIWYKCFQQNIYELTQVYRQKHDQLFIDYLSNIRLGKWNKQMEICFQECLQRELIPCNGVLPTKILTHKKDVDKINQDQLMLLTTEIITYHAQDHGEQHYLQTLQRNCPAKTCLQLKIGAQVILVKTINSKDGLVNGARGVIIKFTSGTKNPIVRFANGIEHMINKETFTINLGQRIFAERIQIPLDLAWAISVHKSQGMTVDQAELHLKNTFEYGQVYVALSRVRSRNGLSLRYPLLINQIKVDPLVLDYYTNYILPKQRELLSEIS